MIWIFGFQILLINYILYCLLLNQGIQTLSKRILILFKKKDKPNHRVLCIWAKSASPSTKMLQQMKMEILDPSGGVLNVWLQICPSRFGKFRHLSSHFWRNQNKILIFGGVLDPSNLKFSSSENLKLEGSRTPPKINILFWFLQNSKSKGHFWRDNVYALYDCCHQLPKSLLLVFILFWGVSNIL